MVCGAGDCAPDAAANESDAGTAINCGVLLTVTVTGMVFGLLAAAPPVEAIVAARLMEPVQVPAVSPAVAMETERVPSVGPEMALVVPFSRSQLFPQVLVLTLAV